MTTQHDIVGEARELLAKATEGPWFTGMDFADDCPDHRSSGLALVDTDRSNDWPIARLCGWHNAKLIARVPELLSSLCDEVERLREQWNTRFNILCGLCGKRYLGPRDEHLHGYGACDGK